jgi:hypothetical protein
MPQHTVPRWKFLTNYASVLVCIAHDPGVLLREISESVGITERAAHRIVGELVDAGYIARERVGRRNRYTIQSDLPLPDRLARVGRVGDLLGVLVGESSEHADSPDSRPKPNKKAGSRVK